jgi:hypothetical protein
MFVSNPFPRALAVRDLLSAAITDRRNAGKELANNLLTSTRTKRAARLIIARARAAFAMRQALEQTRWTTSRRSRASRVRVSALRYRIRSAATMNGHHTLSLEAENR